MPTRNVAIAGLGLIGGSLAKAWRSAGLDLHLTAFDHADVLAQALADGTIDRGAATLEAAVSGAEVVVLALPLPGILDALGRIGPHLAPGALVTDVGSVKSVVEQAARALPPFRFVGGHPMAGAEKGGYAHADAFLFENATYVLCPPHGMAHADFTRDFAPVIALVEATGARVLVLDADRHDRIAAQVSHVPQLLATTLAAATGEAAAHDDALFTLAAGGFRDMTRIAESPFDVWQGILAGNRAHVLDTLARLEERLHTVREALEHRDDGELATLFSAGADTRRQVPHRSKGFLRPLHEIRLHAVDEPGFLARVTRVLFDAGLNVKDLELLKVREGTGGTFRVAFARPEDVDAALTTLSDAGFRAEPL